MYFGNYIPLSDIKCISYFIEWKCTGIKRRSEFFQKQFTVKAYENIFTNKHIWRSYGNTIFVAVVDVY